MEENKPKMQVAINLGVYTDEMFDFMKKYIEEKGVSLSINVDWDKMREDVKAEMLRIIKSDLKSQEPKKEE